jgi:hypothetical protein
MGILEAPEAAPDVYGIPEYRISEVKSEIDGKDVRMVFGAKRFGQIHWLYTVVASAESLLKLCNHCEEVALQAINIEQVMQRRGGH